MGKVLVLRGTLRSPAAEAGVEVVPFDELRARIGRLALSSFLLRWDEAVLRTHRLDTLARPLLSALVARSLSRGRCRIEDERGASLAVGPRLLASLGGSFLRDLSAAPLLLRRVTATVASLEDGLGRPPARRPRLSRSPLYLRTDLSWGLSSGGSVGHIAGVLNSLGSFGGAPIFVTTDAIPTVSPGIETHVVPRRSASAISPSSLPSGTPGRFCWPRSAASRPGRRPSSTSATASTASPARRWRPGSESRSCWSTTAPRSGSTATGATR